MAGSRVKMRGIKPDFWTDEDVVEVSAFARLLFIGLWQMACDNGHIKDSPKRIKMSILPADDVDIKALLGELIAVGMVARDGRWLSVPKMPKHQRIDRRYFLSCDREGCCKPDVDTAGNPPIPAQDTQGTQRDHDGDTTGPRDEGEGEGEGEGENNSLTGVVRDKSARAPRGCRLDPNFIPSEESRAKILAECPQVDLRREHAKFIDYWTDQAGAKGVRIRWNGTWCNWMRKAAEQTHSNGAGKSRRQQETDDLFDAAARRMGVTNQISIEGRTA